MNKYIESREAYVLIREAFKYESQPGLREKLVEVIGYVRSYQRELRRGVYDYLQHVDCGRQDAWGAKVDDLYRRYNALKIAWGIRHGCVKRLDAAYKACKESRLGFAICSQSRRGPCGH